MQFGILGPLEVATDAGRPVELVSHKLRSLLALLVIEAGRVVSLDRIIDQLWGDEPPATATGTLQAYVSQLRRLLEPDRLPREPARILVTQAPGYVLRVTPDKVDFLCFERLAEEGEKLLVAGRPQEADTALGKALGLWRGEPLAEFAGEAFARVEASRLSERRLLAWEHRLDAWLALGRHAPAAAELERLVGEHPLRERLWGLLMIALYRDGRQADALRAYQRCRQTLADELGLEPGPELHRIEQAVVTHDAALDLKPLVDTSRDEAPPPAPVPARRTGAPAGPAPAATAGGPDGEPGGWSHLPPLVGREAQLRCITERLAEAKSGRGGVVLVEGEPGIGKTRLVEEVAAQAERLGMAVAWSRCSESAGAPPFWPWTQVLEALDHPAADRGGAPGGGENLAALLSGRRLEGSAAGSDATTDPAAARFRLHQQVAEHLLSAGARQPLVVVIDDLHWADASSRQLLAFLAGELPRGSILVVATFRTGDDSTGGLEDLLGALARERNCERITLRGLAVADVERYLKLAAGASDRATGPGGRRLERRLASALHDRTDGNPFFLIELFRLLTSEKTIDQLAAGDAARVDVPGSVRDVVQRRLARLPEDTRTLLRVAAVIGRQFDLDLLEAASGIDGERLMTLIEPTLAIGLVVEATDSWSCRFSHALVQETLYAGLSRLQRARIHRRVAEALEAAGAGSGGDLHLEELAHHFSAALPTGTAGKAVDYASRAAVRAGRSLAYDEAVGLWELALSALTPSLPDYQERRYEILLGLGEARRWAGDVHRADEAVKEAIALARLLGDPERTARAAVVFGGVALWNLRAYGEVDQAMVSLLEELVDATGPDQLERRAQLLGTLAVELCYSEDRSRSEAYAAEAVELARRVGDPELIGRALNNFFLASWKPDREAERRAATEEALRLAGAGLPRSTEVIARMHRMWSLLRRGELDAYDAELATCRRLAGELRITEIGAQVAYGESGRAILAGRWADAERLGADAFERMCATSVWGAQWCRMVQLFSLRRDQGRLGEVLPEMLDHCEQPGGAPVRPTAVLALASAGRLDEARAKMEAWGTRRPWDWSWDFLTAQRAEVAVILGAPDPGVLYDDLVPLADRLVVAGTGITCWGSVRDLLGRLAARLGDLPAAVAHLEEAVACNRRLGARPFEARSGLHLARLLAEHPQLGSGRSSAEVAAPALAVAREVGMDALVPELTHLAR